MANSPYEQVYKLLRTIPAGRVTTYGSIGKKLGISPRYVGHILHMNPDGATNPCHRVVNSSGKVAEGYAFGGRGIQKNRLEEEGIVFKNETNLDLKKYFFQP
ncbi:MAG TPA: methylated-DNA--[protein]-cysteine S-methyltransferase [Patescibacteria group bacterium]|nr:methylated-DNA--[protein]-cysteine S-methyltransferase [Patescibacteria group bacterium]